MDTNYIPRLSNSFVSLAFKILNAWLILPMHHLLVTHVNYKQTLYDIITNEGI